MQKGPSRIPYRRDDGVIGESARFEGYVEHDRVVGELVEVRDGGEEDGRWRGDGNELA
jgi:hypothetical protein